MSEDEREMAALRGAGRFKRHQKTFGDRHSVKQRRLEAERQRNFAQEVARDRALQNKRRTRAAAEEDAEKTPVVKKTKLSEEDMMAQFFPMSFGKKKKKKLNASQMHRGTKRNLNNQEEKADKKQKDAEEGEDFGPSRPLQPAQAEPEADAEDSDSDDDGVDESKLPITHEASFSGHEKAVTALTWDKSGACVVTGSYDYTVKMYNFAGMNSKMNYFRTVEPVEGHQVRHIEYSIRGDSILVIAGSARPKIFSREGSQLVQFCRGDMYLHDLRHTKGHVNGTRGGSWHPHEKETVLTCAEDGTLRIWDINIHLQNQHVLRLKTRGGLRTPATACCYSPNGALIAGAGHDGSIQLWGKGRYNNPTKVCRDAHARSMDITCLKFASDSVSLFSRGEDGFVRLWDARNLRAPLNEVGGLEQAYPEADLDFSPDGKYVITGTSTKARGGRGDLVLLHRHDLTVAGRYDVTPRGVIRVAWHNTLNQIVVTTADACAKVLYNPTVSVRGALLCAARKPREKGMGGTIEYNVIRNPNALKMFKDDNVRKKWKDRKDKVKARIPERPLAAEGMGGRVASHGHTITQHWIRKLIEKQPNFLNEDPREALLAHDEEAKKDPWMFGPAYQGKPTEFRLPTEEELKEEQRASALSNKRSAGSFFK